MSARCLAGHASAERCSVGRVRGTVNAPPPALSPPRRPGRDRPQRAEAQPRTFLAITSRWISLVPSYSVVMRASRYSRSTSYSLL